MPGWLVIRSMALPYFTFFARVLDICDAQLSIISVSLAALPLTMPKKYELISLTSESSPNLSFNAFYKRLGIH